MKNTLYIIVILCFTLNFANAQELKYKNVFQDISTQPVEVVYQELLTYQKQDPPFANTYYQLGLIAQKWTKEIDFLQDYQNLEYFLNSGIKNFGDAKKLIDDKEARKHREYYTTVKPSVGDKVQLVDIQSDIDNHLKDLNDFSAKVAKLNTSFKAFIRNYLQAQTEYRKLVSLYPLKNQTFILGNENTIKQLNKMKQSFDSAKLSFSSYRSVLDSCPTSKYKQNLSFKPIANYAIDGFASANFFDNSVVLWDFGTLANEIISTINGEVASVRAIYTQIDQSISKDINQAFDSTKVFNPNPSKLEPNLLNKIYRLDPPSVLCSYLKFKASVLKLLEMTKAPVLNGKEPESWLNLYEKLRFMDEVAAAKKINDSLAIAFTSSVSANEYNKYKTFFDAKFGKIENMKSAISNDQKSVENSISAILTKCRKQCMTMILNENLNTDILESKEGKLSLKTSVPDLTNPTYNICQSYKIVEDLNGDKYATGYLAKSGKRTLAFIARIQANTNGTDSLNRGKAWKIAWLKTLSLNPNFNECGAEIRITSVFCYFIVNSSVQSGGKMINTLVKFDKQGNDLGHTVLADAEMPRSLSVDEINDRFVCAYKGKTFETKITDASLLTVAAYKANGDSIWRNRLEVTGNVVDMLKTATDYLVYCNFNKYTDTNGSEIISFTGCNTVLVNINESGKKYSFKRLASDSPYFSIKAFKINSEKVGLFGLKTDYLNIKNPEFRSDALLYFSISEADGWLVYDNMK